MSQIKISELTETQSVDEEQCMVPVDDGTSTKKISLKNLELSATASAAAYASAAAQSATDAEGYATSASTSSTNASTYASNASDSATAAAGSASSASGYADTASAAASNASASAGNAAASATSVAQQVASAEASATLARSWAEGGTGARAGEDTNNAKHWAEVAASMHDGVASFNGRNGIVTPANGDYSASMIARGSSNVNTDLTNIETNVTNMQGDITGLGTNKEDKPTILTQTLSAGATTLTFTDDSILNTSRIKYLSNPFVAGLIKNAVQSEHTVTLTCKAQQSSVSVKLEVYN